MVSTKDEVQAMLDQDVKTLTRLSGLDNLKH